MRVPVILVLVATVLAGCLAAPTPSTPVDDGEANRSIPKCDWGVERPCRAGWEGTFRNNTVERIWTPVGPNVTLRDHHHGWWYEVDNATVIWRNMTVKTDGTEVVVRTAPAGCESASCYLWGRTTDGVWNQSIYQPDTSGEWWWEVYIPDRLTRRVQYDTMIEGVEIHWPPNHTG